MPRQDLARTDVSSILVSPIPDAATKKVPLAALSPRERQCLELLAHGQSNSKIAANLGISLPTVALHLASARRKLGAITREHAIALAISRGMFSV